MLVTTRQRAGRAGKTSDQARAGRIGAPRAQRQAGTGMVAPFLALFAVFFVGPLIYSLVLSLRAGGTGAFAGLLNFRAVIANSQYWGGVQRMCYFGVIQVSVMIGLALILALYLDSTYCVGRKFFALVYFLPYAVPGVIAAIMWAFLLEPDLDGALKVPHAAGPDQRPGQPARLPVRALRDHADRHVGVRRVQHDDPADQPDQRAATDRGRGQDRRLLRARHRLRIKFPLIRRTVMFTIILSIIGTLQLFNEPVVLNDIASTGTNYTPNQIIYNTAFSFGNESLAAAQSLVLAVITIGATMAFYTIMRRRADPLGHGLVRRRADPLARAGKRAR